MSFHAKWLHWWYRTLDSIWMHSFLFDMEIWYIQVALWIPLVHGSGLTYVYYSTPSWCMGESLWVRVTGGGLLRRPGYLRLPFRRVKNSRAWIQRYYWPFSSLGMFRRAMSLNSFSEFQQCDALTYWFYELPLDIIYALEYKCFHGRIDSGNVICLE
jgi:hypothetical protein